MSALPLIFLGVVKEVIMSVVYWEHYISTCINDSNLTVGLLNDVKVL